MKRITLACCAFALLMVAGNLYAQANFTANLNESQANAGAGTGSTATGTASMTLNVAGDTLTYSITLTGLDLDGLQSADPSDDVTALHFHNAPAGSNGGVVFGLISPNHDTDDLVIDPVAGTLSGAWEDTDVNPLSAQLANLNANNLYLNVHTTTFPGGEIRGQVLFLPPPPVTQTIPTLGEIGFLLLVLTLGATGFFVLRRRTAA